MKNTFYVIVLFIALWGCKESERGIMGYASTTTLISQWLRETHIPSLSYTIVRNGEVIEQKAYGFANIKSRTPVDTLSFYSVGSNFKSVTCTAIMQLHEKGLLDIEAPINDYLKNPVRDIDPDQPIRIKHLMSHQSGIPTSFRSRKLWSRNVHDLTFGEIAQELEPNALPGTTYQYSNDGYALLGDIIEKVTGQDYEAYVFEHILQPLGITTHGFSVPTAEMMEDMALPYHMRYNVPFPMDFVRSDQYPSGDIYLRPMDMTKFLLLHLNRGTFNGQKLLSEESIAQMHRQQVTIESNFHYGFGFGIEEMNGGQYSFHQGSMPGYLSVFRMDLDTKSAVFLATNVTATPLQEKQLGQLLDQLFRFAQTGKLEPIKELPMEEKTYHTSEDQADVEAFVGSYGIEGTPAVLTIEKIGKQLYLKNPANQRFRMAKLSESHFFLTTENEDITFTFDETTGKVSQLQLESGGTTLIANKINGPDENP